MCYRLNKPYTNSERANFVISHRGLRIAETDECTIALEPNEIMQDGEVIINPNYEQEQLEQTKINKIVENDRLRDTALLGGVTYNNVLFDSDDSQKINLLATYKRMTDTDTVVWYGMNGGSLLCTKADIQAIGDLIYDLTAFVWSMNDYIKEQIEQAKTIEEVNAIKINYDRADT